MDLERGRYKAVNGSRDNVKARPRSSRSLNNRTVAHT